MEEDPSLSWSGPNKRVKGMLTVRPCGTSESETRALQLVAQRKPSMAPLAAEGGQHGNTLLRVSEGVSLALMAQVQTSGLACWETINSWCSKPPSWWHFVTAALGN